MHEAGEELPSDEPGLPRASAASAAEAALGGELAVRACGAAAAAAADGGRGGIVGCGDEAAVPAAAADDVRDDGRAGPGARRVHVEVVKVDRGIRPPLLVHCADGERVEVHAPLLVLPRPPRVEGALRKLGGGFGKVAGAVAVRVAVQRRRAPAKPGDVALVLEHLLLNAYAGGAATAAAAAAAAETAAKAKGSSAPVRVRIFVVVAPALGVCVFGAAARVGEPSRVAGGPYGCRRGRSNAAKHRHARGLLRLRLRPFRLEMVALDEARPSFGVEGAFDDPRVLGVAPELLLRHEHVPFPARRARLRLGRVARHGEAHGAPAEILLDHRDAPRRGHGAPARAATTASAGAIIAASAAADAAFPAHYTRADHRRPIHSLQLNAARVLPHADPCGAAARGKGGHRLARHPRHALHHQVLIHPRGGLLDPLATKVRSPASSAGG
mmetsp:Transcript_1291/g.4782  ORF Transcript_1291/g.4782 Transcript_1291/m.4782 type:complete len:441 (+) Transcript_1291:235-1557(+)